MTRPNRILLLEDEPAHAELVREAFARGESATEVSLATTVAEARERLANDDWDLVLADWLLPDGNALDLLAPEPVRDDTPVVVMTSHGNERIAVDLLRAGAVDYVVKSAATLLDLPRVAARALREHRQAEELRRTQAALQHSQATLESIVRTVPDIIYRLDTHGRITFISHAVTRYGYRPEELIGRPVADIIHPNDRQRALCRVDERRTRGRATRMLELRLLAAAGDSHQFEMHERDIDGAPVMLFSAEGLYASEQPTTQTFIGTQGIARDITSRRQNQRRMMQLAKAVEGATDGVLLVDPDGAVRYCNPSFLRLTGLSEDAVLGKRLSDALVSSPAMDDLAEHLRQGRAWHGRLRERLPGGLQLRADASLSPVCDGSGHVVNAVLVVRDVAEQEAMEERLRQAVKLEAIGTLAGGIAHDFNNILTGIIGHAELALLDLDEATDAGESVKEILDSSRRAADLTRQILAFARRGDNVRVVIDPGHVVREALRLLRASLPPTVELTQHIAVQAGSIAADPAQVHQVVMNLCSNAYQAMGSEGGHLEVSLRPVELSAAECVGELDGLAPGGYQCLAVTDDGPGIPASMLPRVFEPFFTTKPIGQGTGLGLSVVHGVVTSMGGRITAHSRQGEGCTFRVYLPTVTEVADDQAAATPRDVPQAEGRILVVDDDETVLASLCLMLRRGGFEVDGDRSPQAALRRIEADAAAYDAVLCDYMMPGLTGVQLGQALLERQPALPVLLITGFGSDLNEDQAIAMGFRGMLSKPVRTADLCARVRAMLSANPT